ncbi:hypothetical protein B0H10DRAFT_2221590 [Mycena sp. CBHHK59/15]|nr:hypothetical protein B0H10DRAFT_2221590 [Mycena sp. CBHHK59/15]
MLDVMGWTHAEFDQFKSYVTSTAKVKGLDTFSGPEAQDPVKWKTLINDCVKKFPALDDFETAGLWRCKDKSTPKAAPKKRKNRADAEKENAIQEAPEQPPTQKPSDNPPARDNSSSSTHATESINERKRGPLSPTPSVMRTSSFVARTPTSTSRDSETSERRTCLFCGFAPPITHAETVELRAFFKEKEGLRRVLEIIGIDTDVYFRAFLRLGAKQRQEFLRSVTVARKFTPVECAIFSEMLDDHFDGRKAVRRAEKFQVLDIPRPGEGLLNVLSKHGCRPCHIKKHMRVSDDDEYAYLLKIIEDRIPQYLDVDLPFESQDEERMDALVKSVCGDHPTFRRYEQAWPVAVHVRRFLSGRAAGRQEKSSTQTPHQCLSPHQNAYNPQKLPSIIAAVLSSYNMEDLGPAFLFLGMLDSDEQFSSIVTSRKAKATSWKTWIRTWTS